MKLAKGHLRLARKKIRKDCTVTSAMLVALAFSGRHLVACDTNRRLEGFGERRSIHAEEMLLRKLHKIRAMERLGKLTVIVLRVKRDGSLGSAMPCKSCMEALGNFGINEIQWSQ
jgi:hypothetical protein